MAAAKRIYLVRFSPNGTDVIEQLVNAKSPAGALRTAVMHLGGSSRYAEQGDLVRLLPKVTIIEEGDTPQAELPLQPDPVDPEV
jgi:hypothetical protein